MDISCRMHASSNCEGWLNLIDIPILKKLPQELPRISLEVRQFGSLRVLSFLQHDIRSRHSRRMSTRSSWIYTQIQALIITASGRGWTRLFRTEWSYYGQRFWGISGIVPLRVDSANSYCKCRLDPTKNKQFDYHQWILWNFWTHPIQKWINCWKKKHQRGECSTCNCKRFPSETPELFGLLKPELTRIDKTTLTTTIWLFWVRSRNCNFCFFTKDYDLSCVVCIVTPHSMLPTRNKRLSMSCSLQVSWSKAFTFIT